MTVRRKTVWGAGALALVMAFAIGALAWSGASRLLGGPDVALETVRREPFSRAVSADGVLQAVHVTPIVVPSDVRQMQKIAWVAPNGAAVKAGEPVILFDPYDAEKLLADGKSGQQSAERKIDKARASSQSNSGRLGVDRDLARDELTRAEERSHRDATVFTRNEIIESEIDRDLLGRKADASARKAQVSAQKGDAEIALEQIARQKAEITIRQAERGLSALRILAPHDGFFALERSWRGDNAFSVGATVWPGQKIGEIPDLSQLEAKIFILEADAGGLQAGCKAVVTIEGRPGFSAAGKVSRVDAIAKTREENVPTKYFETIVALDKTDPELMKPGQSVRARVTLEDIPDAIAVPRQAIFEKDDHRVVYRLESGHLVPVEVTIGRSGPARVVIEKGLEPGDRIALRDPAKEASDVFSAKESAGDAPAGGGTGG